MRIDWQGDDVLREVAAAAALGVDRTMAEAVDQAKRVHEWVSRSGHLEGSIMILDHAKLAGTRVGGTWGASANYALYVEVGTSRIGPTAQARVEGSAGMWTIPPPQPPKGVRVLQAFTIIPPSRGYGWRTLHTPSYGTGPLKDARPYLRTAASTQYQMLSLRIAQALHGEAMS